MRSELTTITPILAAQWLQKNSDNRRLSERQVEKLVKALTDGQFKTTHQGIAFASSGRLLDGQHRLEAIKRAGISVQMFVWYDAPEDTYAVMDAGYSRKIADRIRRDAAHVSMVNGIMRFVRTNTLAIQEYEAELLLDVFVDGLRLFDAIPGSPKKRVETAGARAALVLRLQWMHSTRNEDGALRTQYLIDCVRKNEMTNMPSSIHAFVYQSLNENATRLNANGGNKKLADDFVRAWKAFDTANEHLKVIKTVDSARVTRDVRMIFNEITKGVFV